MAFRKYGYVKMYRTYKVDGMAASEVDIPNTVQGMRSRAVGTVNRRSLATTAHHVYMDGKKIRMQCEVEG